MNHKTFPTVEIESHIIGTHIYTYSMALSLNGCQDTKKKIKRASVQKWIASALRHLSGEQI